MSVSLHDFAQGLGQAVVHAVRRCDGRDRIDQADRVACLDRRGRAQRRQEVFDAEPVELGTSRTDAREVALHGSIKRRADGATQPIEHRAIQQRRAVARE